MAFDDGLVTLLERNHSLISDKRVLLVGDISSVSVLSELKDTKQAYVVSDNYDLARRMSTMIGEKIGNSSFERASKKHVSIIFSAITNPKLKEVVQEVDVVVVFLCKSKKLTQNILFNLNYLIKPQTKILLLGSNAIGGKSADSLVKQVASVYKLDIARKCTLFSATLNEGASLPEPKPSQSIFYQDLEFKQDHGVFSQGEIDRGSALLLECLDQEIKTNSQILEGDVLDLGCGCGLLGIYLKKAGAQQVVCTDISATALDCTKANSILNQQEVAVVACNMLPQAKDLNDQSLAIKDAKFKTIVTNPPFHEGIARNLNPTLNMIASVKDHLVDGGALYLVGNTSLHYEDVLVAEFKHFEILKQTPKFTVFKAVNTL